MFCIMCQIVGIPINSLEIRHRSILATLGHQIEPYDDANGLCRGICIPCEEKMNETYKLKMEKDDEDKLLGLKEDRNQLKEVINCLQQKIPISIIPVPKEEPADDKEFLDIEEFSWIDKNTECNEDPQPVEICDSNAADDQTDETVTTSMNCSDQILSEQQELSSSSNILDEKEINYKKLTKKVKGHLLCRLCKHATLYRKLSDIKMHIDANHLNIWHICKNCGSKYKYKRSLIRHIKIYHPRHYNDGNKEIGNINNQAKEKQAKQISEEMVVNGQAKANNDVIGNQRKSSLYVTRSKNNDDKTNKSKNNLNSNCATPENELDLNDKDDEATSSYKVRQIQMRFKYTNFFKKFNDNYICSLCKRKPPKKFGSIKYVSAHIKYSHFKFRYECLECGVSNTQKCNIKRHFRSQHNGVKCKYKAIWNELLPTNTAADNLRIYRKQGNHYICNRCNVKFKTLDSIEYHIKEFHYEIINFKKITNNQSSSAAGHRSSVKDNADVITNQKTIANAIKEINYEKLIKKVNGLLLCRLCKQAKLYRRSSDIKMHIDANHFNIWHICKNCGSKYKYKRSLIKHIQIHHPRHYNDGNKGIGNINNQAKEKQAEQISEEMVINGHAKANGKAIGNQHKSSLYVTRSKNIDDKTNKSKNNLNSKCATPENELDLNDKDDEAMNSFKVRTNFFKKFNDKYICSLCKPAKRFNSITCVSAHIKYFHYKFRYKCFECEAVFAERHDIKKHFRSQHNGVQCKYKTIWNDLSHMTAPDHQRIYRKQANHYICGRCNVKFKTLDSIKYHINEFHCEIINWKSIENNQSSAEDGDDDDDYVDEAITNQNIIEGEIMIDTNSENENQNEEKQMPSSSSQLKFNFENKYKKEDNHYVCLLCSNSDAVPADKIRKCITLSGITRHIRNDHYGFRYICSKCGKKYSKMGYLAYHYKKVHNIVKHVFEATSTERPSKYEQIHKDKIHSKRFYFKEHCIIKDGKYQCILCPKVSRKAIDIKQHLIKCHFKNRYKCKECPKEFEFFLELIRHKGMEHYDDDK